MLWITLVLFIVGGAVADKTYLASCPHVKPVKNLNIIRLSGRWYEAGRYDNIFELEGKCVTTDFTLVNDGSVKIENKLISSKTDKVTNIDGTAKLIGKPGRGEFVVTYPSLPIPPEIPHLILGTNYADWLVLWSCSDDDTFSYRYGWILTKERNPPDSVLEEAYKVLKKKKICSFFFHKTDQKNCPKTN